MENVLRNVTVIKKPLDAQHVCLPSIRLTIIKLEIVSVITTSRSILEEETPAAQSTVKNVTIEDALPAEIMLPSLGIILSNITNVNVIKTIIKTETSASV